MWCLIIFTYFVCSKTSRNDENRKEKTKKDKMANVEDFLQIFCVV